MSILVRIAIVLVLGLLVQKIAARGKRPIEMVDRATWVMDRLTLLVAGSIGAVLLVVTMMLALSYAGTAMQ